MATEAQINTNLENPTHSTGPMAPEDTREDHAEPTEYDVYCKFVRSHHRELNPETQIELTLAAEIIGAAWRMQRCARVETDLDFAFLTAPDREIDPDRDDKIRRSLERARAAAHAIFHRSLNQLRKLQTQRIKAEEAAHQELLDDEPNDCLSAEEEARREARLQRARQLRDERLASNCKTGHAASAASDPPLKPTPVTRIDAARNAPCPCGSGIKFKRCCIRKTA